MFILYMPGLSEEVGLGMRVSIYCYGLRQIHLLSSSEHVSIEC